MGSPRAYGVGDRILSCSQNVPSGMSPRASSFHWHEDAVAHLGADRFREVPLAGGVLDQDDLAGADDARSPVAGGDLDAGVEVDDVLPARRRVPVEVVIGLHLAEDDAGGGQALRKFAGAALLGPFDLDVAEMRLAAGVGIEVVDAHRAASRGFG